MKWLSALPTTALLGVLPWALVLVLAIVVVGRWSRGGGPAAEPAVLARVDTVLVENAEAQRVADSLAADAHEHEARAARAEARARRLEVTSTRMKGVADSFAIEARHEADSASVWRLAYDARTTEAELLREERDEYRAGFIERGVALAAMTARGDTLETRLGVVEPLLHQLRSDLARAEEPCRVVWKVPCPSRTQVGVVTAVAGVLAGVAATR